MIKRGTWWLLVGAIALGGGVLLLESNRESNQPDEANTGSSEVASAPQNSQDRQNKGGEGALIFPFSEGEVDRITLNRADETLAFTRATDGTWQMSTPQAGQAESGAIAFLLSQLTNPTTRTLSVEPSTLQDFGLVSPDTTIDLTANDTNYQLAIGSADFTGDNLYVQLTAPKPEATETTEIYLVSGGLKNAIDRPTAEWRAAVSTEEASEEAAKAQTQTADSDSPTTDSPDTDSPSTESSTTEPAPAASEASPNQP